jgi:hypothetical protein
MVGSVEYERPLLLQTTELMQRREMMRRANRVLAHRSKASLFDHLAGAQEGDVDTHELSLELADAHSATVPSSEPGGVASKPHVSIIVIATRSRELIGPHGSHTIGRGQPSA